MITSRLHHVGNMNFIIMLSVSPKISDFLKILIVANVLNIESTTFLYPIHK